MDEAEDLLGVEGSDTWALGCGLNRFEKTEEAFKCRCAVVRGY